jgi:phage terminase small subunit
MKPAKKTRITRGKQSLDNDGLNVREALFVRHYVANNGNGKQAAIAAGYVHDPCVRASRLLKIPHIRVIIARVRLSQLSELDAKAERVLREVVRIAFFDLRRLFKADGTLLPIHCWPDDAAAAVSGLEYKGGSLSKLRFASKIQAVELLGRHLNLWEAAGNKAGDRLQEIVDALREPAAADAKPSKKETVN